MTVITRRALAAGLPLFAIGTGRARAAEFSWKFANNVPATHPLNLRATEAADRIRKATNGAMDIQTFPNSQLGSDTDTLGQLRAGAVELFTLSGLILANYVPLASINGVGFAFKDYPTVWGAMDGALGALVRAEVDKRGLYAMPRIFDNGFRQVTTSTRAVATPDDLKGMKLRVPPSPLWVSMFQALGASPTSINFNEVYSALQTRLVDGQENPLTLIDTAKLYEVQKYCSLTNHMWDGYWLLANKKLWQGLPDDVRQVVEREMTQAALDERADLATMSQQVQSSLAGKGLVFNGVDTALFQGRLREAGFYSEWRGKYGDAAWGVLEGAVGKIA